ncbi:MAG: hypothetical protein GY708_01800 [Actinomycetia bacterium]|nr:hypothetical protein [Actinomycetes bacterium]MCP4960978.1 hypothetical protein [Actinomycetes bacterium]
MIGSQPAIASALAAAAGLLALVYRRPAAKQSAADKARERWQTQTAATCLERAAELVEHEIELAEAVDLTTGDKTIELDSDQVDLRSPHPRGTMRP